MLAAFKLSYLLGLNLSAFEQVVHNLERVSEHSWVGLVTQLPACFKLYHCSGGA